MKPEEKRIKIAEACGYKLVECPMSSLAGGQPFDPNPMEYWMDECWDGETIGLPDYLNDLNDAMECCKVLALEGWRCCANMGTDGTWECFFTKRPYDDCILPADGDHYGAGDTLSASICDAFIRVKLCKD